jgi:hypothetical protein
VRCLTFSDDVYSYSTLEKERNEMIGLALSVLCLLLCAVQADAEEPFEGRTLISPKNSDEARLLDMKAVSRLLWNKLGVGRVRYTDVTPLRRRSASLAR